MNNTPNKKKRGQKNSSTNQLPKLCREDYTGKFKERSISKST